MDEDLKRIELQAAKVRLEREKLLLENEQRKKARVERVSRAAQEAADVSVEVGAATASALGKLIVFAIKSAFAFLFYIVLGVAGCALWVLFAKKKTTGDFQYEFGYFLGEGGWLIVLGIGVVGVLQLWFGKNDGSLGS